MKTFLQIGPSTYIDPKDVVAVASGDSGDSAPRVVLSGGTSLSAAFYRPRGGQEDVTQLLSDEILSACARVEYSNL